MLNLIFKRFDTLYPRLLKNQQQSFKGTAQITRLTVQDQIKLCKSLAKSESVTLSEAQEDQTLPELEKLVASMIMNDSLSFDRGQGSRELFAIFLYMYSQYKAKDPSKGFQALITALLKQAQALIVLRSKGSQAPKEEEVKKIENAEDHLTGGMNIDIEISLKNDEPLDSILEVIAVIIHKLVRMGEGPTLTLLSILESQIATYLESAQSQVLNLEQFAPTSIVYKILEYVLKDKRVPFASAAIQQKFDDVLQLTLRLFEIYKVNSKYFMIILHSSSKNLDEERNVRRMSVLFTDLLDLLVAFSCQYLKALARLQGASTSTNNTYIAKSIQLYQCLFAMKAEQQDQEYFTLRERLRILSELNSIFNQIDEIVLSNYYWGMIREGLHDLDQYCRKVSMAVLKANLKQLMGTDSSFLTMQNNPVAIAKPEFELMWTTFFDLYDTLESFGSHLTKAVWERSELFYAFIKKHYDQVTQLHPLIDFREWLMVLYKRVQSHMNLKLRRYVLKSTLKRTYMTKHMGDYVFDQFLKGLNKGLLFKDSNIYTQFSLKNQQVNAFYKRYFVNECVDLRGDLQKFFTAFVKHVSHPQLMLSTLKNLARDYPTLRGEQVSHVEGFIGNEELQMLYDVTNSFFGEQIYSSTYLCWKYVLQMIAHYLDTSSTTKMNHSLLLKIFGKMPIEFFTTQALYQDPEAHTYTFNFIKRVGGVQVLTEQLICPFINDMFQVKALVQQMPKFGKEIDLVIEGLARLILATTLPNQPHSLQNAQNVKDVVMRPQWDPLQQILGSAYLSPEVLDSKVRYLTVLLKTLYRYGDDNLRKVLRQDFVPRAVPLVLERLENNLLIPLTKYDQVQHQPSEMQKVYSVFSELDNYYDFLHLSITACHIHMNASNAAVERTIKILLQMGLRASKECSASDEGGAIWNFFLTQYIVFKGLKEVTMCYAEGIRQCLKKGITFFMVAEDVFQMGQPLLMNIVEFNKIQRPRESEEQITGEQKRFLIDNCLTLSLMAQDLLLSQWHTLSHLIQLLSYEKQSKDELLTPLYPLIAEKAADFLGKSTKAYNTILFRVLKDTYIPVLLKRINLLRDQVNLGDNLETLITDYQYVCYQCWGIIKELQTEFDPTMLQEFLEFTFNPEVMETYAALDLDNQGLEKPFHQKMAREIFDQGNRYWLITRTAFNHLLSIISVRPHLLKGFEEFILNFAICREVRSLDSDILLYKLQHLIPQIFKKDYENLNMEEITYQGAYIRTMTLIVLEELIKNHKLAIAQGEGALTQQTLDFTEGMERLITLMINVNYDKRFDKGQMPYSDAHRTKVRCWQTLVVLLDFLDPTTIYAPDRRTLLSQAFGGTDILRFVNKELWNVISLNHLPSVRSYIEIVVIRFSLAHPAMAIEDPKFVKTLLDPNMKITVASSYLVIAGFVMTRLSPSAVTGSATSVVQLKQRLLEHMSGFLTSNGAHVRCVSQYFIYLISKDPIMKAFIPAGLQNVVEFLHVSRDCQKVIKRNQDELSRMEKVLNEAMHGVEVVLSTPIDESGEFLSQPFVERIKEVTSEVMTQIRNHDEGNQPIKKDRIWKAELEIRKQNGDLNLQVNEASQSNYQRKILPWDQVEYDHELLKRVYEGRRRNEIIMCAALIDKIPNLAGLARTSEIMNASCLVINNRAVCETEEFKGVSVTSEKWLPMYEVSEKDLYSYLVYQKSNGYKILGLEQTANSKMLHEYKFPSKCVMLLGKEKEGIPQEYLSILDECIEIPQFGVIRSLNVHVSGALCLWEYTKQHLPATNNSQRQ